MTISGFDMGARCYDVGAQSARDMPLVVIRTEGNSRIGAGHVGRCLAIAEALMELEIESLFVLSSNSLASLIESQGFSQVVMGDEVGDDATAFIRLLVEKKAGFAIVDSFRCGEEYLSAVRKVCPTFVFYGSAMNGHLSDILCSYAFSLTPGWLQERYGVRNVRCLEGPAYAPLGRIYWDVRPFEPSVSVGDILVTSGGSDSLGICSFVAAALVDEKSLESCTIHIAVGPLFDNVNKLRMLACENSRVVLHEGERLIDLLSACDLAICSGGTSVYEVMRMGVPAVFYSFVENQVAVEGALAPFGHVGDIRNSHGDVDAAKVDLLVKRASSLAIDEGERARMSILYRQRVDGQGARRIAAEIMGAMGRL